MIKYNIQKLPYLVFKNQFIYIRCHYFGLFQSLWQSESFSFVAKVVKLWDHWLIITMVRKLLKQSSTESCTGWYILFLVWCLISPSGLFIRAFDFVIFVSDLPEVVPPGSTIAPYADDCKCSRIIDTVGDLFQQDLDNLHQWSVWNFMSFNIEKCKIMKITKKTQPLIYSFFLDNSGLEEVEEFKDLGIFTNKHLSWNPHIDLVVSKAIRVLGLIKRT